MVYSSTGCEYGRLDRPYFDAGGGDIWMITRSVLLRDADGIFAIITMDLPFVPEPTPTSFRGVEWVMTAL